MSASSKDLPVEILFQKRICSIFSSLDWRWCFFSGFIAWSQWLPRKTDNQYWDSEITSKCKDCRPLCLNWQDWNWQFSNKPPFVLRLLGTPVEVILIILGFTLGKATEQIGRSKILYGRLEFLLITYNVNFVEIYLSSILWFWMAKDLFFCIKFWIFLDSEK